MIYIIFYEKIKKYTLILLLSIYKKIQITSPQQVFTTYLNIYLPVYLQNLPK